MNNTKINITFLFFTSLFLNSIAQDPKQIPLIPDEQKNVQKYCKEFTANQQIAEELLKNTIQSTVDDLLEGKFSPRVTWEKFSSYPKELFPYLKEESLALIIKNIRYNVEIENVVSKDLLDDASAMIEALVEIYDKSETLKVLHSGLKTNQVNKKLKNKCKEIFRIVIARIITTTEQYADFKEQLPQLVKSSEYFETVSELDKETLLLLDILQSSAQEIASLCKSEEVKNWVRKLTTENTEQLKKIARAFILRFASEIMLESQLNHGSFNIFDMISISTKILSGFKTEKIEMHFLSESQEPK